MVNKRVRGFLKKTAALCLTAAMLFTPIQAFADNEDGAAADVKDSVIDKKKALEDAIVKGDVKSIKNHDLIAENDALALYLYEPALSLIIRDKETGAIMESTVQDSDGTLNATWENFIKSGIGFDILNCFVHRANQNRRHPLTAAH